MSEMDWLAKQMEKATQDHGRQQKQEERRACRQQLLSRIRSWCVLIVIALCVVFAVVYRERVSTLITTAYSSVFPGDKAAPGEKPGTGSSWAEALTKPGRPLTRQRPPAKRGIKSSMRSTGRIIPGQNKAAD